MATVCGDSTFVSGSYSGTVLFEADGSPALAIGHTDDGFEIEQSYSVQEITSDAGGDSVLNGIYRGGNCFCNMTLIEFNSVGASRLRRAYVSNGEDETYASGKTYEGSFGEVGCTVDPMYSFVLTLSRVSPANATNSYGYYVFRNCIVDPNFPLRWNMNSRLWALPLRARALPYWDAVDNTYRWYEAYNS